MILFSLEKDVVLDAIIELFTLLIARCRSASERTKIIFHLSSISRHVIMAYSRDDIPKIKEKLGSKKKTYDEGNILRSTTLRKMLCVCMCTLSVWDSDVGGYLYTLYKANID